MKLLIDGDAIIYKVGFATEGRKYVCPDGNEFKYKKEAREYCKAHSLDEEKLTLTYEPEEISHALSSVKQMLKHIFEEAGTDEHIIFLKNDGPDRNFRKKLDSDYKKNRESNPPPYHAINIKEYLEKNYTCEHAPPELEVDDMLGIHQETDHTTCIVSHDKDLLMVPGEHIHIEYNSGLTSSYITKEQGLRNFYIQCLTGDKSDNVPGIYGIGKATAKRMLQNVHTVGDMNSLVEEAYEEHGIPISRLELNQQLLWIKQDIKDLDTKTGDLFGTGSLQTARDQEERNTERDKASIQKEMQGVPS